MTFLLLTLVSGIYLFLLYKVAEPYPSVARLDATWFGSFVRSLHRYAADLAIVAAVIHALRMFLSARSFGPRAMAWVTGLFSIGALLFCGWTGLVMAWDVQGQLVALEGARLADLLPVLSEPISRSFTQPEAIGRPFFFMNLFLHVALPLGLAALYWLHVSHVARAPFFPPRPIHWYAIGAVVLLSLLVPVPLPPQADLLAVPVAVPLDLFYAFWLPLARNVTPAIHLLSWLLAAAVAFSVPWWWRRPKQTISTTVIDENHCTGCSQCYLDCPYEAISMIPRTVPSPLSEYVARVDPASCVGCAICSASCAPMGVGPAGRSGRDQLEAAREFVEQTRPSAADVVLITCSYGLGTAPELLSVDGILPLPSGCSGSVHTSVIEYILRAGAGGVFMLTCADRDCIFREGPRWLIERAYYSREADLRDRVDKRRLRIASFAAGEVSRARSALTEFRAECLALAPVGGERNINIDRECETQYVEP